MLTKVFPLFVLGILSTGILAGQCPGDDSLQKRIALISSATVLVREKLKTLLELEQKSKQCNQWQDTTKALLLQKIASAYFNEADYIQAIHYIQQSIDLTTVAARNSLSQSGFLIKSYYDLSRMYDSVRNVRKRLAALDSCAAVADRINEVSTYHLYALHARVQYFFDVGEYNRCISYAERCEKLGRQYAATHPDDIYNTGMWYAFNSLGWIVNSLLQMNDYNAAEKLLVNKINECKKIGLQNYYGTLYGQLAEVKERSGNYNEALSLYNKSLMYEQQWGASYNCKVVLNNIAYLYGNQLNDTKKALFFYKKALHFDDANKQLSGMDSLELLNIAANIGRNYSRQNEFDSAFYYFQRAFNYIKYGMTETDVLSSSLDEFVRQKKVGYLSGLLISKADAYLEKYKVSRRKTDIEAAIRAYKISDKVLDRIRHEQSDQGSKLFWRSDTRRLYEHAIEACYLQGNTTDAFYFFEKSRAVLLGDQLNERRWKGENEIQKQAQLTKKIAKLEKELSIKGAAAGHYDSLKKEIFTAKQELDRLEQNIKTNNPLYYQSFLDTNFITVRDVQQHLLNPRQALLELFSGDSAMYALLVTGNKTVLTKINKWDFETTAARYIAYLSDANMMNRQYAGFVTTSSALYQMLFQNLPVPGSRIIISPDGQYFPFESLITKTTPVTYFISDHAVSYTYSARFLANDFDATTTGKKNFLGVAPVNYPSVFSLAALPGSDQSLKKISYYFDDAVNKTDLDASRNDFLQNFSQYRIIQLYTHAADSSDRNDPVIYFADSALYLSDLVNDTRPVTRLIVLSACETGGGKIYHGEGIFSFNRGFAALGIPAAITNLWSVDNVSTYKLTELFYKWLAKGLPADVALQKAKLEFMQSVSKEKSLPCFWAGPVLVGKADAVELKKSYRWKWLMLIIIVGCIGFLVVRKWNNLRKAA